MIPCNPCANNKCGSCVADTLETNGIIRSAAFHCGCSEKGHKNDDKVTDRPIVKTMFSKVRDDDPHVPEPEVVEE